MPTNWYGSKARPLSQARFENARRKNKEKFFLNLKAHHYWDI